MGYPSLQSDATSFSSFSQISVERVHICLNSVLSVSAGISSSPAALLFFRCFMALLISSLVGLSHLMGRSNAADCKSGGGGPAGKICSEVLQNLQPIC